MQDGHRRFVLGGSGRYFVDDPARRFRRISLRQDKTRARNQHIAPDSRRLPSNPVACRLNVETGPRLQEAAEFSSLGIRLAQVRHFAQTIGSLAQRMSNFRILRALLQRFRREMEQPLGSCPRIGCQAAKNFRVGVLIRVIQRHLNNHPFRISLPCWPHNRSPIKLARFRRQNEPRQTGGRQQRDGNQE